MNDHHSYFKSFWMGGFECADHLNRYGERVDLLAATGHPALLEDDYQALQGLHLHTVREGICWSKVEYAPYQYDWSAVRGMMQTGRRLGIQQVWDLCHFGYPDDLSPMHPHFAQRFTALCTSFIALFRSEDPDAHILVTPINEVSFLSWLGGEAAATSPFCTGIGWQVKYQLARAYIGGVRAMRALDDRIVIMATEPLVHAAIPPGMPEALQAAAAAERDAQYQIMDMLTGKTCPELGGSPDLVDIVGVNFYYCNQWQHGTHELLPWAAHDRHPDWQPLHLLLAEVYARYQKPLVIAETSHPGEDRPLWIQHIAEEAALALGNGLPLQGICIYPVTDRPDWDDLSFWHRSGIWDNDDPAADGRGRTLHVPYAEAIGQAQRLLQRWAPLPASLPSVPPLQVRFNPSAIPTQKTMNNMKPTKDTAHGRTDAFPEWIICFSHLRWDFVFQRPQHLLTRMARQARVLFIEEPVYGDHTPHYTHTAKADGVTVLVPHLPDGTRPSDEPALLRQLLDALLAEIPLSRTAFWYYTPMALKFSRSYRPGVTVFDCMDELSAFRYAPQELKDLEQELLDRADVVFTGGASLYEAKKHRHANIHLFPSSIDKNHFGAARQNPEPPADQAHIPHPRLGFFGVIDERFDAALIEDIARRQPGWQLIIIGPVVKIDPAALPVADNIHYLGSKPYAALPAYLSGWDIALIPFALNESTRFISPTKTPEYLAAGIPVISEPLHDVVSPYGESGLVHIAATADDFIRTAQAILATGAAEKAAWLEQVDDFLKHQSWDDTTARMSRLISIQMPAAPSPALQNRVLTA